MLWIQTLAQRRPENRLVFQTLYHLLNSLLNSVTGRYNVGVSIQFQSALTKSRLLIHKQETESNASDTNTRREETGPEVS